MRFFAGAFLFYISFFCFAQTNKKVPATIEGTVVSDPVHFKSKSGDLESYSFKVKTLKGEIVSVTYTKKKNGQTLLNFDLRKGSPFKESGELATYEKGQSLKPPYLGSFYVNRLAQIKPLTPIEEKYKSVESRLQQILTSMTTFYLEFDSFTSDFVSSGVRLPQSNQYICGFSGPFVGTKKDVQEFAKADRFNDSFLDSDFQLLSPTLRALLKQIPKDALVSEKTFKVACVANLDADPGLDVWTIDDKKTLIHVQAD